MEVTTYKAPTSWSDKGMNWNKPNPLGIDYAMALALAIHERSMATAVYDGYYRRRRYWSETNWPPPCQKYGTVNYDFALWVLDWIISLVPHFVDLDSTKKGEITEDHEIPVVNHSIHQLCSTEDSNILMLPGRGAPTTAFANFFKRAKACLDKLTVTQTMFCGKYDYGYSGNPYLDNRNGKDTTGYEGKSLSQTISSAIGRAKSSTFATDRKGLGSGVQYTYPIWAWSGNVRSEEDDDYIGFASFQNFKATRRFRFKPCKSNLLVGTCAYVDDAVFGWVKEFRGDGSWEYAYYPDEEVQSCTFDDVGIGLKQDEMVFTEYGNFDKGELLLGIKSADEIPKNTIAPYPRWENGREITRSTKRGFWANLYFFDDYNVPGGFQFCS